MRALARYRGPAVAERQTGTHPRSDRTEVTRSFARALAGEWWTMEPVDLVVRGVRVGGDGEIELGVTAGRLADGPSPGAEVLPGRHVLAGLVDAHAHVSLDLGGPGRPGGSPEVVADSLRAHLHAGVLLARDVGAPVGVRVGGDHHDGPHVLACGRFLALPGRYVEDLFEGVSPDDLEQGALDELDASGSGWVKLVVDFPELFTGVASFREATANYAAATVSALCDTVHAARGAGGRARVGSRRRPGRDRARGRFARTRPRCSARSARRPGPASGGVDPDPAHRVARRAVPLTGCRLAARALGGRRHPRR